MANERKKQRNSLPRWARITLRILRGLLIPLLCLGALVIGLTVGYAYFGGQDAADVFRVSTWKHLYDLVFANN